MSQWQSPQRAPRVYTQYKSTSSEPINLGPATGDWQVERALLGTASSSKKNIDADSSQPPAPLRNPAADAATTPHSLKFFSRKHLPADASPSRTHCNSHVYCPPFSLGVPCSAPTCPHRCVSTRIRKFPSHLNDSPVPFLICTHVPPPPSSTLYSKPWTNTPRLLIPCESSLA